MESASNIAGRLAAGFFASLLLALQPAWCAPARPAIGRVSGPGPVQLNGIWAPVGTNVYAGNRVTTGPEAIGHVTLERGGKLALGGSTSARITQAGEGYAVQLESGALGAVSEAKAPIVVTASGVTIRAKQASGSFEVELNGNTLNVFARSGPALAETANRTVEIEEGSLMRATLDTDRTPAANERALRGVAIVRSDAGIGLDQEVPKPCNGISPHRRRHHNCEPD